MFHKLPLKTLITWTRWFGVVGAYLRRETDRIDIRIARLRTDWSARGRELNLLEQDQAISRLISQLGCSSRWCIMTDQNGKNPKGLRARQSLLVAPFASNVGKRVVCTTV